METVEKIKKLIRNAGQIKDLFNRKIPMWQQEPSTYDKTRWGFVQGDCDGWYKDQAITLHFGAWMGTYGDSSTYKQIDLDGDVFKLHFLQYLNKNRKEIMMAVAELIEKEANSLKEKAQSELGEELSKLQSI